MCLPAARLASRSTASPPPRSVIDRRFCRRASGITLVEMLISVTLTLVIMFAVVRVFELMGSGLTQGRATIEMAGQLRSVAHRMQQDLDWITVSALPWISSDSGMGYLEIIEGPGSDRDPDPIPDGFLGTAAVDVNGDGVLDPDTAMGDIDDVLMFTVRSHGEPFVGRIQGTLRPRNDGTILVTPTLGQQLTIESQLAEVIWWIRYDDVNGDGQRNFDEPFMLYRRLLLVRPDLDLSAIALNEIPFFNAYDVSARPNPAGSGMIANSLSDLTMRENRYAHLRNLNRTGRLFPYPLNPALMAVKFDRYLGEDVMLSDVLSLDVRVYDPQAPIDVSGTVVPAALVPGDPGYVPRPSIARGAYVDLYYDKDNPPQRQLSYFSGPSHPMSRLNQLPDGTLVSVYDTWPENYERDGIDQNRNNLIDEGTNGLDDDNRFGVDDVGERETAAPYGVPLRGLQVTIRMMDFSTRQVRQVSVVGDFVPE